MDKDEVKVVKIVMEGGIIQDIELPPGVKVIVRDYDVEGGIGEPGEVEPLTEAEIDALCLRLNCGKGE